MKKAFNRLTALLGLPTTLLWLFIWKVAGNQRETLFHAEFFMYLLGVVKTGETSIPEKNRRIYP